MRAFAGERVPTLEEVIAAAGDAIRLNIELKPPTPASDVPLADAVLAAVRGAGLVGRCRVCSQSYVAMRRMKAAEPGLTVGFIAGAAVGDLARLQVDFLMLSGRLATGRLVREAHARGLHVHPWTVNDPDDLPALLDRGIDNVITDVPAAIRARLEEVRRLSPPERLLLRVRNLLAD
jgi:glycerophosphoryl diester phosphodiesterase